MRARLVAKKLINKGLSENDKAKYIPPTIKRIVEKIKSLSWYGSVLKKVEEPKEPNEEDIPF